MALDDYYSRCAFPKQRKKPAVDSQAKQRRATRKKVEAADDRARRAVHRTLVQRIFLQPHWHGRCSAEGVSPVCTGRARDPHELIPRGAGGEVSLENTVPICRECHHEANGKVGGNRLTYEWPGRADGVKPRADIPGNVRAVWKSRSRKGRQ